MELKEFVQIFSAAFEAPESITSQTHYKDHKEWCSIVALTVMAVIRKRCKITVKVEELRNCTTVEELYELIKQRQ